MKHLLLLFAVISLVLGACSSKDEKAQALKAEKLVKFEQTAKVKRLWSVSAGSGQDKRYSLLVPAIANGAIYVTDVDGRVYAYDQGSRKKLWSVKTKKDISASVSVFDTRLYFGTYDGQLVALDANSGEQLWEAKTSSEILSVPASSENVVVAQTIDGRVYGFSAEDGSQLWRYDHTVPALTLRGTANPVISRRQVVAAFGNGQLISLNLSDGSLMWSGRVSQPKGRTELEKMVDIDGSPIVDGGLIYAATYHGAVAAFGKAKGNVIWKQDLSTYNNLSTANGRVFAVTEDSHVVAYNAGNGALEWTNDQLHRRDVGSPLAIGDYLVCVDSEGYLHVLNQSDGEFVARAKPKGKGFRSPMLVLDDSFLVLSDSGALSAYRIAPK